MKKVKRIKKVFANIRTIFGFKNSNFLYSCRSKHVVLPKNYLQDFRLWSTILLANLSNFLNQSSDLQSINFAQLPYTTTAYSYGAQLPHTTTVQSYNW